MGGKSSLMLRDDEIRQVSEETGFSAQQIEKLYTRFTHLDRANCGSLSREDLLAIPELAINPICERLIEVFFVNSRREARHAHRQPEERINFRQFVYVLAAFRSHSSLHPPPANGNTPTGTEGALPPAREGGSSESAAGREKAPPEGPPTLAGDSLRQKLFFVFRIYDADQDGRISFADLRTILKLMVGDHIRDVQLDKIATRAFLEVDRDHDGFIEFGEFCKVFAGKDMDLFRLTI